MIKLGSLFFLEIKVKIFCLLIVNFKVGGGGWKIENIFNMYVKFGYFLFLYL